MTTCKECWEPIAACKCSLLERIAHLEQQAARLTNLPELPEGVLPPFSSVKRDGRAFVVDAVLDSTGRVIYSALTTELAGHLVNLLNTCYPPAPGQES